MHIRPLYDRTCQIVSSMIQQYVKYWFWAEISLFYVFNDFPKFLDFFINIHEFAKYVNYIICIFDHVMEGPRLSFNLSPSLVV